MPSSTRGARRRSACSLLALALGAFFVQRRVVGRRVYTAISGKGDSGRPAPLPPLVQRLAFGVALPWALLTVAIYGMALAGGFVETWGRNYTPTLRHYAKAFSVEWGATGIIWSGSAWRSFWTTLELASIAAPLTAALGILTAYLLVRQRFAGRAAFEFATMLSFAIPGTVIGVSYILAFNVPPVELTGTGVILIVCFVFRNMPVGLRAGMAAMSQIDGSLDEASRTLGGRSFVTLRRVILPLLRPAVVAALVYSFVRAMTTVSAVIFLVSADYDMATTFIIHRVLNGDYGVAIAYSSVLIVLMLGAIGLIQLLVGERRLRRQAPRARAAPGRTLRMSDRRAARIELAHVTKRYGPVTAVRDVSFIVAAGSLVTLLGPSGCGKTTTLRLIAGLETVTSGRILIGDDDVTALGATDRSVSMVFQSYALFPHMSVLDNVAYGPRVGGRSRRDAAESAREALAGVGLAELGERLPSELSGGQQQRVAIARALVLEPRVLLFDEPLSNLDARLRRQMREEIRALQQRLGITVVYVTHDQEEALGVSDRIIVMNHAVVAQEGPPRDLYETPDDVFVAGFMGEANRVKGVLRRLDDRTGRVTIGGSPGRCSIEGFPTVRSTSPSDRRRS